MPTRDRRSGPNGSRRPQRREEKIRRAATLAAMQYRLRWPERRLRTTEPGFLGPSEPERSEEDPAAESASQFEAMLGLRSPGRDEKP